jgi:hypothetical protein
MYGDIVMSSLKPYCPNRKCDGDLGLFGNVERYSNNPIILGCQDCDTTLVILEKTSNDVTEVLDIFMHRVRLEIERRIRKLRKI